jgi:hypothetical protein
MEKSQLSFALIYSLNTYGKLLNIKLSIIYYTEVLNLERHLNINSITIINIVKFCFHISFNAFILSRYTCTSNNFLQCNTIIPKKLENTLFGWFYHLGHMAPKQTRWFWLASGITKLKQHQESKPFKIRDLTTNLATITSFTYVLLYFI